MKRRTLMMLPIGLYLGIALAEEPPKALVCYFSRRSILPNAGCDTAAHATPSLGNTADIAEAIARLTGAKLFEIKVEDRYPPDHRENSRIAKKEKDEDYRPRLASDIGIAPYSIIYLGFPIWWYQEPMAVRTFIEAHEWKGKTVVPFCSSMGVDIREAASNLKRLAKGARVLDGRRFATEDPDYKLEVKNWIEFQKGK